MKKTEFKSKLISLGFILSPCVHEKENVLYKKALRIIFNKGDYENVVLASNPKLAKPSIIDLRDIEDVFFNEQQTQLILKRYEYHFKL